MKKNFTIYLCLLLAIIVGTSGVKKISNSVQPPTGYTGASSGLTCATAGCHSSFALNSGGGSVVATGLPTGSYVAGQAYNFSITISHPISREMWGFAIKAVNTANNAAVGTFSTTNANAGVGSGELSHRNAVASTGNSFTYDNLKWTAPVSGSAPSSIRFYFVGNAADGTGGNDLDYIYSSTVSASLLPIILSSFTTKFDGRNVVLNWKVENDIDSKYFIVEKSADKVNFEPVATINSVNASTSTTYSYVDTKSSKEASYYRLKLVDKNGNVNYSKILSIISGSNENSVTNVYPNPAKKGKVVNVEMVNNKDQTVNFVLVNSKGAIVSSQQKIVSQGFSKVSLQFSRYLTSGNYYLQAMTDKKMITTTSILIVD